MDFEMSEGNRLYQQVAARIASLIEGGTLEVGTRVPSVRALSEQHGISISTALQAYRTLENEGFIEARPQSGYYVRRRSAIKSASKTPLLPPPETSAPPSEPIAVNNRELVTRVIQAANQPGLFQLGTAICCPTYLPTEALHRALIRASRDHPEAGVSYDFPPGALHLRAAIARRALDFGCAFSPDDILPTIGATEAIVLCLRAVTQPGDAVAIESPTYYNLLQILESLGLRAVEIATDPREGVVLESLEETLEREPVAACLFVTNFGNPHGACLSDERKKRLVELLEERQIPLIEDDVWGDTGFKAPRPRPAKAFDQGGNVLLVSSFSKTLAPGYRVGWVAAGKWGKKVEYQKLVSSVANPTLPGLAIAEFLERGGYDHHLRRLRRFFAEQTQMALEGVARHFPEGTKCDSPSGGHFLWVELPKKVRALDVFEDALQSGISIAPGPIFSARQKFSNFVRLNCGFHSVENTEKSLETLGRLVRARM